MQTNAESILSRLAGIIGEIDTLRGCDGFTGEVVDLFNELPTVLMHIEGDNAQEHAAEAFATGIYGREIVDESGRNDFGLTAVDGFCLARLLISCNLKQTTVADFLMLAGVAAHRAKGGTPDAK
jgi:hypothetical protein